MPYGDLSLVGTFCTHRQRTEWVMSPQGLHRGGGTQLWVTRHVPPKRPYFFSLAFTERPPFLPTFTQWPPIFRTFRHFWRNVEKFLAILALKAPMFDAFHYKTPYFCALCHSKTPLFDAICHRKTPTSEVLGGTRTSLSYVSAPRVTHFYTHLSL